LNNNSVRNEILLKWFNNLVNRYYPYLSDFAFTITHSRELAGEIVDDVFMKIWDRREEVSHIENLPSYLYKATKNTSLNYLEKINRHPVIPFENLPEISIPGFQVSPEDELISEEFNREYINIINSLPGKCKLIFRLAKEDGLKYREIAVLLDISEKTVENQISIALKKITECLKKTSHFHPKKNKGFLGSLSVFF
jgi:RNA polymerase sigma-70 factor (family 1)